MAERIDLELTVFGTASIGAVIVALNHCKPEATVAFDFCYLSPTTLNSYRGWYDHLAVAWAPGSHHPWPTVDQFRTGLRAAVGATFTGWKGGEYVMRAQTPLWVDAYGDASGTGIIAIEDSDGTVTLVTAKVD